MHGWINVNKPAGLTSSRVVGKIRRLYNTKKVGHAGTLDPDATGVLPIALGEATKTIPYFIDGLKGYRFAVRFGIATDTDDSTGEIINQSTTLPSADNITKTLPDFIGKIKQTPPIYSAIKINGKRACDRVRKGEDIVLKEREVTVHSFDLLKQVDAEIFEFEVTCGKGTYVRSLARELGVALGTFGHTTFIHRTQVGCFSDKSAILLDKLEESVHNTQPSEETEDFVLPIQAVLDDIPVLEVNAETRDHLTHGRMVPFDKELIASNNGNIRAEMNKQLIAICTCEHNNLKPVRVFNY